MKLIINAGKSWCKRHRYITTSKEYLTKGQMFFTYFEFIFFRLWGTSLVYIYMYQITTAVQQFIFNC